MTSSIMVTDVFPFVGKMKNSQTEFGFFSPLIFNDCKEHGNLFADWKATRS